jgi:hypothetical protein
MKKANVIRKIISMPKCRALKSNLPPQKSVEAFIVIILQPLID